MRADLNAVGDSVGAIGMGLQDSIRSMTAKSYRLHLYAHAQSQSASVAHDCFQLPSRCVRSLRLCLLTECGHCDCPCRIEGEILLAPITIDVVAKEGTLLSLLQAIRERVGVEEEIAITMNLAVIDDLQQLPLEATVRETRNDLLACRLPAGGLLPAAAASRLPPACLPPAACRVSC